MAEFFSLSIKDRLEALEQAANMSGRPPHLLEKDIWVVWSLRHIFTTPYASHLVFKGGTSLSKAYGVIQRFSEDVDLTYDIRAIAPDLIGDTNDPLPVSKSQEKSGAKRSVPAWLTGPRLMSSPFFNKTWRSTTCLPQSGLKPTRSSSTINPWLQEQDTSPPLSCSNLVRDPLENPRSCGQFIAMQRHTCKVWRFPRQHQM